VRISENQSPQYVRLIYIADRERQSTRAHQQGDPDGHQRLSGRRTMPARNMVSLTPAERVAVWSRHTRDSRLVTRDMTRAIDTEGAQIPGGAHSEANTWSYQLGRYLEGWSEANPGKIFSATAHDYCFDDPQAIRRLAPQAAMTDSLRGAIRDALANCARNYDSASGRRFQGRDIVLMIAQTTALRALKIDLVQDGIFSPEQMAEWERARVEHEEIAVDGQ
jgi:hypothetical protein